jgi:Ca2+-binding EF-hand superfamily protein
VKEPSKELDLVFALEDLSPKKEDTFDSCVTLARKHHLRLEDVRKKWDQYRLLDENGDRNLSLEEFQKVVRIMCKIPDDRPIPAHLTHRLYNETDTNGDGMISFEEFLLWSTSVQYSEEMLVPDPAERMLRLVARQNGLHVQDVDRIKVTFDKCDIDLTKSIEETQFKKVVAELMNMKPEDISDTRMKRYWREVVPPHAGNATFKDVAVWWHKTCTDNGQTLIRRDTSANLGMRRETTAMSLSGKNYRPSLARDWSRTL